MSDLDRIVQVTISRETQAVPIASFGTYGIIAEFATDKTTTTFDRFREYASLTEMTDDGWTTSDAVYEAATIVFSQNPSVSKIMVGRIDDGDADLATGLAAIQAASSDWYCWNLVVTGTGKIVFDADFVASNQIDITVNGTTVDPVVFNTDQATTMADIKAQIETDITDCVVTIDPTDVNERTLLVEVFGVGVTTLTAVVTLGASQPVATITFIVDDDVKAAAAWNETQKKIFLYASSESGILDSGSTTDLAYFMQNLAYDRTVSIYHTQTQEGSTPSWIEAGWPGETLPYDPGSQTWAYKTIAGVATYSLTSGQKTAILNKNCNTYTTVGGVNITQEGVVASGEYIDIIRGLDWLEARLQQVVYTELVNNRKVPYTNEGIALIENAVRSALEEGADDGLLIKESIVVTVPKLQDISTADKLSRTLPDVDFSADLQGAIHIVKINGTVTV